MSTNLIAGVIGTMLVGVFLLYYVVSVRSVPLSVIIVAILLLASKAIYDEVKRRRNNQKPQQPASGR
ncbi:MAG: hypothetical protein ACFCUQ_15445 [Kiloniellales bacterium]